MHSKLIFMALALLLLVSLIVVGCEQSSSEPAQVDLSEIEAELNRLSTELDTLKQEITGDGEAYLTPVETVNQFLNLFREGQYEEAKKLVSPYLTDEWFTPGEEEYDELHSIASGSYQFELVSYEATIGCDADESVRIWPNYDVPSNVNWVTVRLVVESTFRLGRVKGGWIIQRFLT